MKGWEALKASKGENEGGFEGLEGEKKGGQGFENFEETEHATEREAAPPRKGSHTETLLVAKPDVGLSAHESAFWGA